MIGSRILANIKSAQKRARQAIKRRGHNMALRSRMRTHLKRVLNAVKAGDKAAAEASFKEAMPVLDSMVNKGMVIMQTMLGSIGGLALLVAAIGIANTMIMAVYERIREVGTIMAIGTHPRKVLGLFLAETFRAGELAALVSGQVRKEAPLGLPEALELQAQAFQAGLAALLPEDVEGQAVEAAGQGAPPLLAG